MKTFLLTILIFIVQISVYSLEFLPANYDYGFTYTCLDSNGDPVSGQTITILIKMYDKVFDETYYLDFDDNTFKTSGWTTKSINLDYDSTDGFYYHKTNSSFSTNNLDASGLLFWIIYDNADTTYRDHQVVEVTMDSSGSGGSSITASDVWSYGTRTLSSSPSTLTAQEVWEYNISGIANAGYAGKYLNSMLTAAQVWDYGVDGYVAPDDDGKAGLYQKTGGGSGGATAQEVWEYLGGRTLTSGNSVLVDEIWNADTQLYETKDTAGYVLKSSTVTPSQFWDYLLTNSTTPNSAGKILSDLKKRNY